MVKVSHLLKIQIFIHTLLDSGNITCVHVHVIVQLSSYITFLFSLHLPLQHVTMDKRKIKNSAQFQRCMHLLNLCCVKFLAVSIDFLMSWVFVNNQ